MKRVGLIFCAVLSVAVAAEEVGIPRNLKLCNRLSLDFDGCLKDAIQDAIPKFVKGYPELHAPILDPFPTPFQDIVFQNDFLNVQMSLKDVNTYGVSKAKILNVRSTVTEDRQRLEIEVAFAKVFVEGEYKLGGTIGMLEIGGQGLFNVSMEGVKAVLNISGRIENDRWVVEHFVMLPEVEKLKIYFDDVFNGIEAINTAVRAFVNQYWRVFYKAVLPANTVAELDKYLTEFMNRWLSRLSYSKLFG